MAATLNRTPCAASKFKSSAEADQLAAGKVNPPAGFQLIGFEEHLRQAIER